MNGCQRIHAGTHQAMEGKVSMHRSLVLKATVIVYLLIFLAIQAGFSAPVHADNDGMPDGFTGGIPSLSAGSLNEHNQVLIRKIEDTLQSQARCLAAGGKKEGLIDQPAPGEDMMKMDRPFKRSKDVENHNVYLDVDFFYKTYTPYDGSSPYTAFPFLLRIDTGRNTEWWVGSDFLTWQSPNCGVNDLSTGIKWQFCEKNPSMAIWAGCRLPTAGGGVGDGAAEPSALISIEQGLGGPWGLGINVGFGNYWNSTQMQRYDQALYAVQLEYNLQHNQSLSLGCWNICPNDLPGTRKGVNVSRMDLGYAINLDVKTQYSIHITRGMSPVDRDWGFLIGVGREL